MNEYISITIWKHKESIDWYKCRKCWQQCWKKLIAHKVVLLNGTILINTSTV